MAIDRFIKSKHLEKERQTKRKEGREQTRARKRKRERARESESESERASERERERAGNMSRGGASWSIHPLPVRRLLVYPNEMLTRARGSAWHRGKSSSSKHTHTQMRVSAGRVS